MANNLNITPEMNVSHSKLAAAYEIQGGQYTLGAVIDAVAGVSGDSVRDESDPAVALWNSHTMTDKLKALNAYLKDTGAVAVPGTTPAGDEEQQDGETNPELADEEGPAVLAELPAPEPEPAPAPVLSADERLARIEMMLGIR